MTVTAKMFAPSGVTGTIVSSKTGTTYQIASDGSVNINVGDIVDLLNDGFTHANRTSNAADGLAATVLRWADFKNADGSALAAAAAAGKFGQTITLGTTQHLISESANNNSKTDDAIVEYVLPPNYVAGQNVTVTVNASITGAGTLTVKTAQIKAYRVANDGTSSADIGPGAATAMTAAGADVPFTVTGTTLNPGDKLLLELETILTETASSGMVANINSVRVS